MSQSTISQTNIVNTLYTDFMKSSNLLVGARHKSGLSQVELARRAGLRQSVISDYERGKREPGADVFLRLLDILGMTMNLQPRRRSRVPQLPDSRLSRLLLRNRSDILDLAKKRGARNVRVFGSVARGTTKARSDIDFLVDLNAGVGLLDLIGLGHDLEDLLGVKVDVAPARLLKKGIRNEVLREAISL
jgi:hypothetical protein